MENILRHSVEAQLGEDQVHLHPLHLQVVNTGPQNFRQHDEHKHRSSTLATPEIRLQDHPRGPAITPPGGMAALRP